MATANAPAGGAPKGAQPTALRPGPTPGEVARQRALDSREASRAAFVSGDQTPPADDPPAELGVDVPAEPEQRGAAPAGGAPAPQQRTTPPAREPAPEVPDAETQRRLSTVQAAEERSRKKLASERVELEREWSPKIKAAQDFEALRAKAAKARSNPAYIVDVMRALGYEDAHFEPMAHALYSLTEAGKADPARRAQAERMLRDREGIDELSEVKRELAELKAGLSQRDEQSEFQSMRTEYLDAASSTIKDAEAPTVHLIGQKNPAKLREALWRHTVELTEEHGEVPAFADVIARYQSELDDMGIPRPAATTTPKPNNQPADKQNPAKTLSPDLGAPRVPPRSASDDQEQHRAETRRMLQAGKLDLE